MTSWLDKKIEPAQPKGWSQERRQAMSERSTKYWQDRKAARMAVLEQEPQEPQEPSKPQKPTSPYVPGMRIEPPAELSEYEKEIWNSIVDSQPAHWLTPASAHYLRSLCAHIANDVIICKQMDRERKSGISKRFNELTIMHERESRAIGNIQTKLRLTPRSYTSTEMAANHMAKLGGDKVRPWNIKAVK